MELHNSQNLNADKFKQWRKSVRNYFSALSHTDYHLGRIWDALKASRFADNTLVIIASDHGLHLGERNRFRKHTLWCPSSYKVGHQIGLSTGGSGSFV
jgi:arylsulfatase A-like enzyme